MTEADPNAPRRVGPEIDPDHPSRPLFSPPAGDTCVVKPCEKCGTRIYMVFSMHTGHWRPVDIEGKLLTSELATPNTVFLSTGTSWRRYVAEVFTREMQLAETGQNVRRYYHQPHQATCKPLPKPAWRPIEISPAKPVAARAARGRQSNVVVFPGRSHH